MCGIWASLGLVVGKERIDRVAHRGPDGSGWRVFDSPRGPLTLGHRRLSIIDTSEGGAQPMSDPTGRYWLVFNGAIYNYRELRAELAAAGIAFRTQSDSEVLLAAIIHWHEGALPRLLGMFSFAFWDDQEKFLLVARDRFGIKPAYLAQTPGGVAFASEIKQVYDLPGIPRRMNLHRVREFLGTGVLDHSNNTMFAGIEQLRGGQFIRIDCQMWKASDAIAYKTWYRLPPPGGLKLSLPDAAQRFRTLFEESIRLHLQADVPLGSCLSGGLDSSSIVAVASRQLGQNHPMTTISAVFDEARVDERPYINALVAKTGVSSRFVTVNSSEVFEDVGEILWRQDEPYGSTSIHAQSSVFAGAQAAGLKVMLDGQGADEPLAGYHAMFGPALADLTRSGDFGAAYRMVRERRAIHGAGVAGQLARALPYLAPAAARAAAYRYQRSVGGADWLAGTALRPWEAAPLPAETAANELDVAGATHLGKLAAVQTMVTSVPMLLHWEDRSSMAHGIEARVPFLDHRLVELAIGLGSAHKMDGARTKVLLREALGADLPPQIRDRNDKIGFATPEQEWFMGPLKEQVREAVTNTLDRYPSLLNRRATLALTDEMLAGKRQFDFSLWRISCVGMWGERFGLSL
jgi:asparagine synthase (glutamine-hydrolysing)